MTLSVFASNPEYWDLDDVHRATLAMVAERTPDDLSRVALLDLPLTTLNRMLRDYWRQEPIAIAAGTPAARCRDCGAVIFWVPIRGERFKQALSIAGRECFAPTHRAGQGILHLADCRIHYFGHQLDTVERVSTEAAA